MIDLCNYETVEEFIKHEVVPLNLKWSIDQNSCIRCEKGDCPIVAVARHYGVVKADQKGGSSLNEIADEFGDELGLKSHLINEIMSAADDVREPRNRVIIGRLLGLPTVA